MKLKQLIVNNFRQFRDKQYIHFASEDTQNVTVILGQNGAGKTGIFRAVLFALFGAVKLNQDSDNVDVHLINEVALQESIGKIVTATVELEFEHNKINYRIVRAIQGRFDGEQYLQLNNQQCRLDISSDSTENSIDDKDMITATISSIMREDISEFFFFDAESLQIVSDLDESSNANKKIQEGIYQLLQVKDLNKAISIATKLSNRIRRNVVAESKDNNLQVLEQQRTKNEEQMQQSQQIIATSEQEIIQAQKELENKKQLYQSSEDMRVLAQKINNYTEQKQQLQSTIDQQIMYMTELVKQGSSQLFSDLLSDIKINVASLRKDSDDNIPQTVLEQTIKDQICYLCGNKLNEHPEAYQHVQELLQKFKYSHSTAYLNQIESGINEVENNHDSYIETQAQTFKKYNDNCKKQKEIQYKIDTLQEQLKVNDNDVKEAESLGKSIQRIEQNINDCKLQVQKEQERVKILQKKQDKLNHDWLISQNKDNTLRAKKQQSYLLDNIVDQLKNIVEDYGYQCRQKVQTYTKEFFQRFIADKDKTLIDHVEIDRNYRFKIYRSAFTGNLSQGQYQILSLAFVIALAKVASEGRSEMLFPLFMDTPFARIDGDNRDCLIQEIPRTTSQWILLLTDTEFTAAERDSFVKQNTVGNIYQLNTTSNQGTTSIEPIKDLNSIILRGENNG
ncbi:hypothetical protein DS830_07840 [Bombilactobacillus bombi]|uniref:AAA family ATPase n=1 Tax=Bombilactobacillus bombi TaxID=1303590 RepID=UPI000E568B45|nr:AAA family ATPase [Bombilactobacillus bombi]AXX65400.1 hypothetical protein DS830_07840 [Bombilactobacillus bombi]